MSNEVITQQVMPSELPTIQQNGEKNVNVNNQAGGIVNINVHLPQRDTSGSAEEMMAIQAFSKEYYQLLVTCEEDVFDNNVITVSANRALSQHLVPPEIFERCSALSEEGIKELKTFPAIICRENTELKGVTDPTQMAVYGYIRRVMKVGRDIKIAFRPIRPLLQKKLCDKKNAIFFDLNMDCAITDLNHSAWSVHKVNLFEAFDEAGMINMPRPLR